MSDRLLPALIAIADAIAADAAPEAAFRAVDRAVADVLGHTLFTVLIVAEGGAEVERVYSSDPESHPLAGRKRMGPTPWGDRVIGQRQHFLGPDKAALRWAYPEHAFLAGLGLGSAINVCVQQGGDLLGILAVLDREHAYTEPRQVDLVRALAQPLVPALAACRTRA
jgi:hypothetical protein